MQLDLLDDRRPDAPLGSGRKETVNALCQPSLVLPKWSRRPLQYHPLTEPESTLRQP
jgi:hypothetical protein